MYDKAGEFLRDIYEAVRDGGEKRRDMIRYLLLIAAVLAVIPLFVNSVIFYPSFINAPMAGQVAGDYDTSGHARVTYKTADGEVREYRAYAKLPKDKPVDICESAFGRPFLCNELQDRKATFQKNFLCLLACLGYTLWFFKRGP